MYRDCALGITIFLFACSPPVSEGLHATIGFDCRELIGWLRYKLPQNLHWFRDVIFEKFRVRMIHVIRHFN